MFKRHLKNLTRFNRERLDVVLMRVQPRPALMLLFNLVLLAANGLARAWQIVGRLRALGPVQLLRRGRGTVAPALTALAGPRPVPATPVVLLIGEASIPQCYRYRIQQKLEQVAALGWSGAFVSWQDGAAARRALHFCHVVIFYRVPGFPDVLHTIEYAKALNKVVVYDVDDLIFDRARLAEKFRTHDAQLSRKERRDLLWGATLYRAALAACPYFIASTPALAAEMEQVAGAGNGFVHRNALDATLRGYLRTRLPKLAPGRVRIFYGSGTKTHDADFALAAAALARALERYPEVDLVLVGHLSLPEVFAPYHARIIRIGLLDFEPYLEVLSQADINIAPLEAGVFADCKSEIKWLEAAVLGVPSVVSLTRTYAEVLTDGVDAHIAGTSDEWFDRLALLVTDVERRKAMGERARAKAEREYGEVPLARNLRDILTQAIARATQAGRVGVVHARRKRLLFVNTLYPPQELGGATVVVANLVQDLRARYGERYDVSVFTYDLHGGGGYALREYSHDGVHVTALSVPLGPDMDWRYRDAEIAELFKRYLAFNQPDLIHFHSIQRLTASVLEAAEARDIPCVVTVHDAWWFSDHQFLLDRGGRACDWHQQDPLIAAACSDDLNRAITRRRYLAERLRGADAVLAVSEFQARLYALNGFTGLRVNRNGLHAPAPTARAPAADGRLRLGYLGGVCAHKGYFFLRDAVGAAGLRNAAMTIVDFTLPEGGARHARWGGTPVTFVPKRAPARMPEFYAGIDVLVAPSLWPESYGLVTREAAAAGVWVVAAKAGGLAEDLRPGIDSHIFTPGALDELVTILQELDANPARYRQPVPVAAEHIRSVAAQVDELDALYRALLQRDTARAARPQPAGVAGA